MTKGKTGLYRKMLTIVIWPLIIAAIAIAITSHMTFSEAIHIEVQRELHNVAALTIHSFDRMFAGDYQLQQTEDGYDFYKGDVNLSPQTDLLDCLKEDTGIDYTFIFYDTRMLTTIKDEKGNRIINTKLHPNIIKDVYEEEKSVFYENVYVNHEQYYAYYTPLFNRDGTCVGMFFAGKPSKEIRDDILQALLPILAVTIVTVGIYCLLSNSFAKELVSVISYMKKFLGELAEGNFKTKLDDRIVQRRDELGEMGRFTNKLQICLKDMVERDGLTKLYSRRIGTNMLMNTHKMYEETGSVYCLAICDIDFFKKVNDSYGHDCGDRVLIKTAEILNRKISGKGYSIRWGGEEFLIIMENMDLEAAHIKLKEIQEEIRNNVITYKDKELQITMTFGLVSCENKEQYSNTVKAADLLLYEGKESGRNRIVVEMEKD